MIHAGDMLENPITGERLLFCKTSSDTGGEAVVLETFVKPDGFVAAAHVHPYQEERFEILDGSVGFMLGGKEFVAGPGEKLTVPAGPPTDSGTRARRKPISCARCVRRCSSSSSLRRCSPSPQMARRTVEGCQTLCAWL